MVLIDISFIKSGGGKYYANLFINKISAKKNEFTVISNNNIVYKNSKIHNNLIHREFIINSVKPHKIINLSNVPYIFKRKNVDFFLHQRYYIDSTGLQFTKGVFRIKMFLKRLYFKFFFKTNYNYIVQTKVMQKLLYNSFQVNSKINSYIKYISKSPLKENYALLINDSVPHKKIDYGNDVFHWLKKNNIKLYTVGSEDKQIDSIFLGYKSEAEMNLLFSSAKYVISFTRFESLGLPYIEACRNECILFCYKTDTCDELVKNYYDLKNIDFQLLDKKKLLKAKFK